MQKAKEARVRKYKALEEELVAKVAKGFSVRNETFVVGSLGTSPPPQKKKNLDVCKMLGINPNYAKAMAKFIVP